METFIYNNVHNILQMIVKDAMVIIHLAKITLLEKSCDYFKHAVISELVYKEAVKMEKEYPEAIIIKELVEKKKIKVKKIAKKMLLNRANQYNIQRGEAESVALYWQKKAEFLATDDDNVRKKCVILNLKMIGTPVIIFKLYRKGVISEEKFKESISQLRKIGWFSNTVLDKVLMEGLK